MVAATNQHAASVSLLCALLGFSTQDSAHNEIVAYTTVGGARMQVLLYSAFQIYVRHNSTLGNVLILTLTLRHMLTHVFVVFLIRTSPTPKNITHVADRLRLKITSRIYAY